MATGGTVQVDVAELGAKLESIVGPGRVSTSRAVCRAYSYSAFWGRTWLTVPDLVVVAATAEEVSQVLRVANEAGVPATPKGPVGQGGFGGPMKGGILLDLTPMDEITVDRKNMKVIAGAGGSFFRLAQELFKHRLMLPTSEYGPGPTVASSAIFPVNAFGKTRYGRNIDLVEGFEVVLPDGQIVRVGSMAYADSDFGPYYRYITGPDLVGLFTQSNGAFGIVTKVAYSCLRLPKCWAFHAYYWPLAQAETFAAVMTEATAMEIFDIHISDRWRFVGLEKAGLIPPLPNDCNFVAYLTVNAESPAELAAKEDVIHEMCRSRGGTYLPGAADHFYAEWPTVFAVVSQPMLVKLFNLTREASGATGMMICDSLNYPTSWFPQVYDKLMKTARKYGLWGEPNMIVYDGFPMKSLTICSQTWLFIDFYDRDWMRRVEAYRAEFREWFGARGGTHQSGVPPYPEYSWGNQPGAHDLLRRIKGLLDPNDILSPGTFEKRDWSR
ncbi:MAG: FAD-binding oxidoreductase [Thermoleophilia bacterium]|nr:FAD-binding oxidoreductase [Thermoleophilia bacterium]